MKKERSNIRHDRKKNSQSISPRNVGSKNKFKEGVLQAKEKHPSQMKENCQPN